MQYSFQKEHFVKTTTIAKQIFFSPQVKRNGIIRSKGSISIYELPHELPNNLRLLILGY